jgi:Tol biopolymer transport system component
MKGHLLIAGVATAVLVACSASSPTPQPTDRAASQAATAVALSKPTIPTVIAGPPTPTRGPEAPSQTTSIDGKLAIVVNDALVVVEGNQRRTIFKPPPGGQLKDPAWSPDGKAIAFAYAAPRGTPASKAIVDQLLASDVMVVDLEGGTPRVAAEHDGPGQILETPAWTGDGKAVLYSYYAPTYKGEELVAEALEVRRKEIGGGKSTTVASNASGPAASRDGKWIAYIGEDANEGQSLKVRSTEGGQERTLVKADRYASLLAPRFSPDSQTIVFSAAPLPTMGQPPPGGAAPKALAPLDALGDLLAPASAEAHGLPWEVFTVPVMGGEPRQVTQIQEDTPYAAWSADGARLLVYAAGGLYRVDPKSAQSTAVSTEGSHGGMDWRSG